MSQIIGQSLLTKLMPLCPAKAVRGRKVQERVRRELNIKGNKPTIDYDKLCKSFDTFMNRVDKAELEDKFKRDLLNKMLQSINLRIDRLNGIYY